MQHQEVCSHPWFILTEMASNLSAKVPPSFVNPLGPIGYFGLILLPLAFGTDFRTVILFETTCIYLFLLCQQNTFCVYELLTFLHVSHNRKHSSLFFHMCVGEMLIVPGDHLIP